MTRLLPWTVALCLAIEASPPALGAEPTFRVSEGGAEARNGLSLDQALTALQSRLADPDPRGLWVFEQTDARPLPAPPRMVLLTNGDRIPADDITLADDRLTATIDNVGVPQTLEWPLEAVRGVLLPASLETGRPRLARLLEGPGLPDDTLLLEGRDRVAGEIVEATTEEIRVNAPSGAVEVASNRVRAYALSRALWRENSSPTAVLVITTHGAIHSAKSAVVRGARVTLHCEDAGDVVIPIHAVARLTSYGQDVRDATQLPRDEATATPYLPARTPASAATVRRLFGAIPRPPVLANRHYDGGLLQVRGRTYARGFGVFSGTALRLRVPEGAERFRATIGIDDAADGGGAAIFRVLADDREIWRSNVQTGRDAAAEVDIPTGGATTFTLAVDYGPGGDVLDLADWCEPVFVLESGFGDEAAAVLTKP
ncbi:MAG: NPCBM/NEW2 domain-containing protein [Planctomyces sp.]|nr:NPCBM/NEW2 domain-containing protein [Planctomyces sp.]